MNMQVQRKSRNASAHRRNADVQKTGREPEREGPFGGEKREKSSLHRERAGISLKRISMTFCLTV